MSEVEPETKNSADELRIEYWPIERLIPSARNARTHSTSQIAEIAGSIHRRLSCRRFPKQESLFARLLKPFFDSIDPQETTVLNRITQSIKQF
jgi:hypothetical protein